MINISNHLKVVLNNIPELPGIYKMLDSRGKIIYIGKSKCLKKRVKSYFANSPKWEKVTKMVSVIHDIDYIVTDTHLEARLLECELIKSNQPVFNSQMKNDKRYVYLKVENYNVYNPLSIVYERDNNTFGPFRSKSTLINIIDSLRNIYPITKNKRTYTFEYHILPKTMDQNLYQENKNNLLVLLSEEKHMIKIMKEVDKKMKEAASIYRYETASFYRDILPGIQYLKNYVHGYQKLLEKNIVLKLPIQTGYKLFWVYKGAIMLKETFSILTDIDIATFIMKGQALPSISLNREEKSFIDFRDILYSEIIALPEDMLIYPMNT